MELIKDYVLEQFNDYVKATIPGKSLAVYRFDFDAMYALRKEDIVKNDFISYILLDRDSNNLVYVGESMNNIKERPFQHYDLSTTWDHCFVVTDESENGYFDKECALYVEDKLRFALQSTEYYSMGTKRTSRSYPCDKKKRFCDAFLEDVKGILNVIGLPFDKYKGTRCKLILYKEKCDSYENGIPCYFKDEVTGASVMGIYDLNARSNRENFILFKGSRLCGEEYWTDRFENSREADWKWMNERVGNIVDNVVQVDLVTSISKVKGLASGCSIDSPRQYFATLEGCSLEDEIRNKGKIKVNKAVQGAVSEVVNAAAEIGRVVSKGIKDDTDTDW